jgi:capsular exopolysaccharide synthesis family protein
MTVRQTDALDVEIPAVVSEGFLHALWRHQWIVLLWLVLGLGAGSAIAWRTTPVFVASSSLQFKQNFGSEAVLAPAAYVESQANVITSTAVMNDAALRLDRLHLKSFGSSSDLFGTLKRGLIVKPGHMDGTLSISFSGPVPEDNAIIVNTVVAAYQACQASDPKTSGQGMLLALDHEKGEVNAQLAADLRALGDFRARNPTLETGLPSDIQKKKLAKLNEQLLQAQSDVAALSAKYDSLVARYGVPDAASGATPSTVPTAAAGISPRPSEEAESDPSWIQNQLSLASANLDLLRSRGLPENNPSVADAKSSVDRLSKQLAASRRNAGLVELSQVASELDVAKRHESNVQAALQAQDGARIAQEAKRAELAGLVETVDRTRKDADELDSQIKQVRANETAPMQTIVLTEAAPTASPISRSARTVIIAGLLGLLLGLGCSIGRVATDHRLRTPGDITGFLRLPVIGVLPHLPGKPSIAETGLTAHGDPMSGFAEAAKTVRSAIFFAGRSTSARTIVVTSTATRDGSTSFASNLAIAMAQAGSMTLLLDANFQNPRIPEIFEIVRPSGLSDVLSGKLPLDRAINRTSIERLEVLACGSVPTNPAELLNSGGFSRLIEQLNLRYQCIILDSPPVSKYADARILAASGDLTVLVVRAGSVRKDAAEHALEQLLSVGARILGAVLNDVILRKPMQRSRGILRFVETPPLEPGQSGGDQATHASTTFRSGVASSNPLSAGKLKHRMESAAMPEVELVD